MKYALLLDSSGSALSVGLALQDGSLLDGVSYEANQRQSEFMVEEIDKILKKHSLTREDLSAIVTSKGPGSYTGVRISLTIAKTISFALSIPLFLVSSLEMLKDEEKPSVCLVNARSKRSYIGVYRQEETILPDQIMDNDAVLAYLDAHPEYVSCGDLA
ncbi:MAG: tRNA (adenosine(37)-N6)-threonylcarbamoyltransferase complex dimerization subunit type 1 TsaB, partial [Bacilli bacterium]|nr:tRNA (adenosine(37)-N6)-threonylcarbamoyltransferase complex dimerization subunit type 1 TsaB [Bacilli bacterium]